MTRKPFREKEQEYRALVAQAHAKVETMNRTNLKKFLSRFQPAAVPQGVENAKSE